MPKFRTLLKNRNFVLYSIGQAFSQFGDRLVQIVLIGFIYKRWPGSTFQLAKLFFFTVIPAFLISPVAGVYIDRWNKRYVMIASDIFRAAAILLIPLFFIYSKNIGPVYIIVFLVFASACFFLPARLSIIPNLVSKEDLLLANSASSMIWVLSGIAGFSFGGILAEWIGIKNSLYVNSFIYTISAFNFLLLLFYTSDSDLFAQSRSAPIPAEGVPKKSFLYELAEGLKVVFFDKNIKVVAYIFFILSSMVGALYLVIIVFIQEILQSMTKDIGIFSMCLFVGVLLGSYIYGKVGQSLPRAGTISASLLLVGVSVSIFAIVLKTMKSVPLGGVSAFFLGFFVSPVYVTANTVIHESIESSLRGRIFSSIGVIINAGFLLFMLISSTLADHIDRFWILIACGAGFAIFGILIIPIGLLKDLT
ncbi:MAG: hypothetical protein A2Z72_05680 [Omnitrophica bacterium RBG_13_46_9]|nr:MAG: hypothetical protein A2Z72_05680 [Omnitrophica bacterium RBG_13_46_9]